MYILPICVPLMYQPYIYIYKLIYKPQNPRCTWLVSVGCVGLFFTHLVSVIRLNWREKEEDEKKEEIRIPDAELTTGLWTARDTQTRKHPAKPSRMRRESGVLPREISAAATPPTYFYVRRMGGAESVRPEKRNRNLFFREVWNNCLLNHLRPRRRSVFSFSFLFFVLFKKHEISAWLPSRVFCEYVSWRSRP